MSENKTVILKDESGAEIKVKDFESLLSEHHLQMRMSYDTDPDSPIQRAAIQRNFVGVIEGVRDGAVALRTEKGEVLLPFDDIEKARLVPQF